MTHRTVPDAARRDRAPWHRGIRLDADRIRAPYFDFESPARRPAAPVALPAARVRRRSTFAPGSALRAGALLLGLYVAMHLAGALLALVHDDPAAARRPVVVDGRPAVALDARRDAALSESPSA